VIKTGKLKQEGDRINVKIGRMKAGRSERKL
jgi:hypothetical protein